jgi:glycosyltransferase involved in cell wall biosynthesis
MKIGFDVAQTCREKAGCGWAADLLIRALVAAAPQSEFILYHQFGSWLNWTTRGGTHLPDANVSEPFWKMSPGRARKILESAAASGTPLPGNPDIVHANSFQAPKVGTARLVYTVHDISFWIHPEYTTEANRIVCQKGTLDAIQRADGFIFVSQNAQNEFERLLPGLLERRRIRSTVVCHGSRFTSVAAPRLTFPTGDWLAVGSLEPRKNYETLLSAMEVYWQRSAVRRPLTIVGGRGWKSELLRERIASLQSKGLVRFRGYVTDNQLLALYQNAFALQFPSHYEGFGLPVVEAMSQACPVITRSHSSITEVGGLAAIYTNNDPTEIAEKMLKLETEQTFYAAISAKSLLQANKFSWRYSAVKVLAFYEELLR